RRLPNPARDRPRRHGSRLRGRAGLTGSPRGPKGPPRSCDGRPQDQERFRREAKAAARLHHTNIVPVFEVGRDRDVSFYAMQLIQGQGLDQVIDELRRLVQPGEQPLALSAAGRESPEPSATLSQASLVAPSVRNEKRPGRLTELLRRGWLVNEAPESPPRDG